MIPLPSQRNPYIIGRPISEPELFFGRQEELSFIEENLKRGEKVILVHGQRRIGKSSLLQNIPKFVQLDKFAFVTFDLEHYRQEKIEYLLESLAETVIEQLEIAPNKVTIPRGQQIQEQKDIFSNKFLNQIYENLKATNLVLLLDEFDAFNDTNIGATLESLFKQLKNTVAQNKRLFVIIFAGRKSADLSNLIEIFQDVPIAEVGLLDDESIKQLIVKPAAASLKYEPKAIQAILDLSAGHPYFIQVLCFAIFSRARELEKWQVTEEDVEIIVDRAIEVGEAGFAWYWDALSVLEKVVFSTIAEAQKIAAKKKDQELKENPLLLLQGSDVLSRYVLEKLAGELTYKGFLNEQGNRVRIELVRRWILQRHPLWEEIKELEKLNQQEIDTTNKTPHQIPPISKEVRNEPLNPKQNTLIQSQDLNHQVRNEPLNPKQSTLIQSQDLNYHPPSFNHDVSSVKTAKNKIYLTKREIWLVAGIILLGVAAIASFMIIIYSAKQSDRQERSQNLESTVISSNVES
ncbi:ATP-binding protein [aff. Roholtiella sp. LEGE 12411]|uniref:ATP-binding protein n=1 Tax=aff. Roholtiella sp. LEGE 12411 TaxID=1828822 RepID=UPI00187FC0B8|nr:ATP-binding protein [aff. Roholtiella sp. LEGE 12411]MBE9035369.1 ATP-binding protein [aff. Roholtiella sp. LEGE 12411]